MAGGSSEGRFARDLAQRHFTVGLPEDLQQFQRPLDGLNRPWAFGDRKGIQGDVRDHGLELAVSMFDALRHRGSASPC